MNLTPSHTTSRTATNATKVTMRRVQPRSGDGGIGHLERAIDDREPFGQLLLADDQRWVGEEVVPAHEGVEAVLAEAPAEGRHLVARPVERRHRLHGLAVA